MAASVSHAQQAVDPSTFKVFETGACDKASLLRLPYVDNSDQGQGYTFVVDKGDGQTEVRCIERSRIPPRSAAHHDELS